MESNEGVCILTQHLQIDTADGKQQLHGTAMAIYQQKHDTTKEKKIEITQTSMKTVKQNNPKMHLYANHDSVRNLNKAKRITPSLNL